MYFFNIAYLDKEHSVSFPRALSANTLTIFKGGGGHFY